MQPKCSLKPSKIPQFWDLGSQPPPPPRVCKCDTSQPLSHHKSHPTTSFHHPPPPFDMVHPKPSYGSLDSNFCPPPNLLWIYRFLSKHLLFFSFFHFLYHFITYSFH